MQRRDDKNMHVHAFSCFGSCMQKVQFVELGGSLLTGRRSVQSAVTALGAVVTLGGRRSAWHLIHNAPDPSGDLLLHLSWFTLRLQRPPTLVFFTLFVHL